MAAITLDVAEQPTVELDVTASDAVTFGADEYIPVHAITDPYEGPYEATPSTSEQTFATEGLGMTQDFTVHAAPAGQVSARTPDFQQSTGGYRSRLNVTPGWTSQSGDYMSSWKYLTTQAAATVTPTESEQTAVEQYRWTTGAVKVAGIPHDYVGSAIERRDSSDLIVTGPLVNVPAGYYAENEGKAISDGSVTASATKSVSGHTATITPRETRTAGYVEPGASDGTPVTVTASELVSGTKSIDANGTGIDVTEYAAIDVAVPTFDALSWLGEGAELIQTYAKETTALSSTSYNGWTPSTTAKTIKSGASLTAIAIDLEQYDYLIRWQFFCEPVYGTGATDDRRVLKVAQEMYQAIIRRPNSLANIGTLTDAGNACQTVNTPSLMEYWNNNGAHTYTWSASYGIYAAATAATFSSSTSLTPNLTVKRPSISARCSTTYFSTANAAQVTQASTYLYTKGWLYRIRKDKSLGYNQYHNVCAIFNDGL